MGCGASAPAAAAAAPAPKPAPDAADAPYVPIAEQPAVVPLPDIAAKPSSVSSPTSGSGGGLPDIHASSKKVQSKLDEEMNAMLNAEAVVELKQEQRKEAKEIFDKLDVDGSGTLEIEELHSVLQKLGLDIPHKQFGAYAGAILKNYDKNTNSGLDFNEFTKFYERCLASEDVRKRYAKKLLRDVGGAETKAAAREAFDKYDKDGSGSIDAGELRALLCDVLRLELTEEQWEIFSADTLKRGDKNDDGQFDFPEFLNLYKKTLADDKVRAKFEEKITLRYDADGQWTTDPEPDQA